MPEVGKAMFTLPVETKGRQGTLIRQFERSAVRLAAQMAGDLDESFEALGVRVCVVLSRSMPSKDLKLAGDDWDVIQETWEGGRIGAGGDPEEHLEGVPDAVPGDFPATCWRRRSGSWRRGSMRRSG